MQHPQYLPNVVAPFLEAMAEIESGRLSKPRCEDLLLQLGRAPLGVFEGDRERIWMQALAAFRYAAILWLYGDFRSAREESAVARRKLDLLGILEPLRPARPARSGPRRVAAAAP